MPFEEQRPESEPTGREGAMEASQAGETPEEEATGAAAPGEAVEARPTGLRSVPCVRHRDVLGVRRCQMCHAVMCATCDFEFPGGIHLCPGCATSKDATISEKRRRFSYWSMGLAVWGLVAFIGILTLNMGMETQEELELIGTLYWFLVMIPGIVGLLLGISALKREARTPRSLWVGVVGNSVIIFLILLMSVVGLFME